MASSEWDLFARRLSTSGGFVELVRGRCALFIVESTDPDCDLSVLPHFNVTTVDGEAQGTRELVGARLQITLPDGYPLQESPNVALKCEGHPISRYLEESIEEFLRARKGQNVLRPLVKWIDRKIGEWSVQHKNDMQHNRDVGEDLYKEQVEEGNNGVLPDVVSLLSEEDTRSAAKQVFSAEPRVEATTKEAEDQESTMITDKKQDDSLPVWTLGEQILLEKALIKYPAKMEKHERWRLIGKAVRGKSKRECLNRFLMLREELREGIKAQQKSDTDAVPQNEEADNKVVEHAAGPKPQVPQVLANVPAQWSASVDDWSVDQQRALDAALLKFPSSMEKNQRWKNIAQEVERKSKRDCVERFKYLRHQLMVNEQTGPSSLPKSYEAAKGTSMKHDGQDVEKVENVEDVATDFNLDLDPKPKGVKATLTDLSMQNVGWCFAEKLELTCSCSVCFADFGATFVTRSSSGSPCYKQWCSSCSTLNDVRFNPALAHAASGGCIGYFDVSGAIVQDMVSIELGLACFECNAHTCSGPMRRDRLMETSCRSCHTKLQMYFQSWETVDLENASINKDTKGGGREKKNGPGKRAAADPRIVIGKPLPNNGACKHYGKSHRWLRFPCCGKAFPCDVCHEEGQNNSENCLSSPWANRMICGFCAHEMPFSNDRPCGSCGKSIGSGGGSASSHWEGGKGCRNKVTMSNKDSKKFANSQLKTTSNKANRVGPKT